MSPVRVRLLDRWRTRLIQHLDLRRWKNSADAIDELESVGMRPKVDIEGMEFVMIFVLVSRIIGRQMPLALVCWSSVYTIDRYAHDDLLVV